LAGGVHFNVVRAVLEYDNKEKAQQLGCPVSVVIKLLNGGSEMTLWTKLLVFSRHKLPSMNRSLSVDSLINRMNGYEIGYFLFIFLVCLLIICLF
jgi:hypothetical protein